MPIEAANSLEGRDGRASKSEVRVNFKDNNNVNRPYFSTPRVTAQSRCVQVRNGAKPCKMIEPSRVNLKNRFETLSLPNHNLKVSSDEEEDIVLVDVLWHCYVVLLGTKTWLSATNQVESDSAMVDIP